jgi:hypothetical protein
MYLNGAVLIMPTRIVQSIPGVHFSPMHWTKKKDKESGRIIGDVSNDQNHNALNDEEGYVAEKAEEKWGVIEHPTIEEFALMILIEADKHGWDGIELWKMDLKGAFALLRINKHSTKKLAFELTEGLSVIHLRCFFGWAATPAVFQVFTRILQRRTNESIAGTALLYVDDFCVGSPLTKAAENRNITRDLTVGLMGKDSVAENKWENGRRIDFVGWDFNLDTRLVTLSKKNHYKAIYSYFKEAQTLQTMQELASRATRYSTVCRYMRPYTAAFYAMTTGFRSESARHKLSAEAVMDVQMWKAFLCLLAFDEQNYARPIESFRAHPSRFRIEYDASLTGLGLVLSERCDQDWAIIQYVGMIFPFDVKKDSSYQNTCGYLAIVAGVFVLHLLEYKHFAYELVGDSMSSLKWSRAQYTKSVIARKASVGLSLIAIQADATLNGTQHIAGELNVICDKLSRSSGFCHPTLPLEKQVSTAHQAKITQLLTICNPLSRIESSEQHLRLLQLFMGLLHRQC